MSRKISEELMDSSVVRQALSVVAQLAIAKEEDGESFIAGFVIGALDGTKKNIHVEARVITDEEVEELTKQVVARGGHNLKEKK